MGERQAILEGRKSKAAKYYLSQGYRVGVGDYGWLKHSFHLVAINDQEIIFVHVRIMKMRIPIMEKFQLPYKCRREVVFYSMGQSDFVPNNRIVYPY